MRKRKAGSTLPKQKQEEFIQKIQPHIQDLYAYALALTKDRESARDLVQETYLRALRAYAEFRDQNFRAWIFKILKNIFLNWVKREKLIETEEFQEEHYQREESGSKESEPRAWDQDTLRRTFSDEVFSALMTLPSEYREVLLLREIEDFSYEEISEILSIPVGTVRSRLHRARKEMYNALKDSPAFAEAYLRSQQGGTEQRSSPTEILRGTDQ